MNEPITLLPTDPTIFAVCEACNAVRKGLAQPQYFGKAYSPIAWRQEPKCENCGGALTVIRRIKTANKRRGGR